MTTKKEAIEFAKQYQWTAKDAERAFDRARIDFATTSDRDLLLALVAFAGMELLERQRLQASQKGLVTKKNNYIEKIELDFADRVEKYEKQSQQERSLFVNVIAKLYRIAKPLGFKDPWIEALLAKYDEYYKAS
jgi:hypothetical protein